ncbi:hypothetical protein BDA99DRAFT_312878 [Phascolomyces articulosus]|uniref:Telomerase reverse transcriptase n=1 Tax=Phascolomyces articulosus TaxID=60185 RepID=A0AAD5JWB9_9FUNG|nr:hypothetical protein BDA99DRAFT_312878 [Phascolomyces articulosus]
MSNYPDHFKKLFKNIIPINDYLVATFNMNLEHVNSPIDRDMLKNKILNRIVIGLPYSIVEYSKEESSKDNTNDRQCNTMAEIIDQVRREILLVGKGNDHMLTSGVYLSLDRDQYNERIIRENITNSVTKELLSPEWDTFLRWTGENIIRHLFKHTVLLVRIQNDNFYQLSGPRVNVVMDHTSNIDTQQTDSTKTITYTLIPGKMLYNKRFLRKPQVLMKNNTLEQLKVMFPREFSKKRKKFPKRLDAIKPIVEQTITANARSKPLSALAHTCISPKVIYYLILESNGIAFLKMKKSSLN